MTDEVNVSWTAFKPHASGKGFGMQYVDTGDNYSIWFVEDTIKYLCTIPKTTPAGTDQADFETNYITNVNKPVFIGEDTVINALAVRDTSDHLSTVSDNRGAIPKTIVVYNSLNQNVLVQLQGDRDSGFDVAMPVGSEFTVTTGTHDYATISDYLPYLRVRVKCSVSPSSGTVSVFILRVKVS